MPMKFDENTRGVWYCPTIPGEQDFLLTLNRIDEEHYGITYGFRYYNSDDPFDEKDRKSWYSGEVTGKSEEEVVDVINNQIMKAISSLNDGEGFTEVLRGDRSLEEFMDEFLEQDFVHAKKVH
jgi:hypothetical protein